MGKGKSFLLWLFAAPGYKKFVKLLFVFNSILGLFLLWCLLCMYVVVVVVVCFVFFFRSDFDAVSNTTALRDASHVLVSIQKWEGIIVFFFVFVFFAFLFFILS